MRVSQRFQATILAVALLLQWLAPTATFASDFRSIVGVWSGTYRVAFPANHPEFPDQSVETTMELEVYKQEDNLIWVINRWRRSESDPWVVEYATGSFDLDDRSDLVIAEEGPPPADWVNTGSFTGELEDGDLYLNYVGPGDGVTFSVRLVRQR